MKCELFIIKFNDCITAGLLGASVQEGLNSIHRVHWFQLKTNSSGGVCSALKIDSLHIHTHTHTHTYSTHTHHAPLHWDRCLLIKKNVDISSRDFAQMLFDLCYSFISQDYEFKKKYVYCYLSKLIGLRIMLKVRKEENIV